MDDYLCEKCSHMNANRHIEITEETKLHLILKHIQYEIDVYLLPDFAISCILGMDFLYAFGIDLDFVSLG